MATDNHTSKKLCRKCGIEKPETLEFFRIKNGKTITPCKDCVRLSKQDWRLRNPDKVAAQKKRSHERNREIDNARSKAWYAENKDYIRQEYWPEHYQEHKTEYIQRSAEWYAENKEYVSQRDKIKYHNDVEASRAKRRGYKPKDLVKFKASCKARKAARRAREANAEGHHTGKDELIQYNSQKGKCWWCSCELGSKWHPDHLTPLARGGSNWPNNIVISCPTCNMSRQDKLAYEWNGKLL